MENVPNADFEGIFYSGHKLVRTQGGSLTLTEANGRITTMTLINNEPTLDRESVRDMWNHLKECLVHCERIEATVTQLTALSMNGSLPFFPLTIGRKPAQQQPVITHSKLSMSNKENRIAEPVLSGLKSFDGSVRSSSSSCKTSSALRRVDHQQQSAVSRTVDVPGIGRAIQKTTGTHVIQS